jgi:hypothetical protein
MMENLIVQFIWPMGLYLKCSKPLVNMVACIRGGALKGEGHRPLAPPVFYVSQTESYLSIVRHIEI